MKATDLRIGNYVNFIGGDCIVLTLSKKTVTVKSPTSTLKTTFDDEGIKPIPLTEDLLIRMGFDTINARSNNYNTTYHLIASDSILEIHLHTMTVLVNECAVECEHVHQLQNLYHSLTGEELTIKETSDEQHN